MILSGLLLNNCLNNRNIEECNKINCPCKDKEFKKYKYSSFMLFIIFVMIIIELSVLVYAVKLATNCKEENQIQRVFNIILALSSPVLYIILRVATGVNCL